MRRIGVGTVAIALALTIPFASRASAGAMVGWEHLLGSSGADSIAGAVTDSADDLLVVGTTDGTLPGAHQINRGATDVSVARYSNRGTGAWTRLVGGRGADSAAGVAVDAASNVEVAETTAGYRVTQR